MTPGGSVNRGGPMSSIYSSPGGRGSPMSSVYGSLGGRGGFMGPQVGMMGQVDISKMTMVPMLLPNGQVGPMILSTALHLCSR